MFCIRNDWPIISRTKHLTNEKYFSSRLHFHLPKVQKFLITDYNGDRSIFLRNPAVCFSDVLSLPIVPISYQLWNKCSWRKEMTQNYKQKVLVCIFHRGEVKYGTKSVRRRVTNRFAWFWERFVDFILYSMKTMTNKTQVDFYSNRFRIMYWLLLNVHMLFLFLVSKN